jgi:general secretion pathway protein C
LVDLSKTIERLTELPWRAGLVVLGVSFLLASSLSTLLSQAFAPNPEKASLKAAAQAASVNVPNPTASLSPAAVDLIIKRNIFNSEGSTADDKKDDEAQPLTTEIVKSDLPVKLVGTIYGGDPFTGIALVENNQKRTINSFLVGDTLTKDAVVKEVHREKIIIDRGGRLEFIETVKQELMRGKRRKKAAPVSTSSGPAPLATEPPPTAYKEEGFERKDKEVVMTQQYRNKLLTADFTKVLQDAKATPNMVDGELRGFVLNRIRKDSIYEKAGLQNDDIVTEVNGIGLTDTAQAIRLLQSLRNESEIEIRVLRGGTPTTFTLQVR